MTSRDERDIAHEARFGDADILVFCDHASHWIPADLNALGLPSDLMQTHIAWDIGSADVGEGLARALGGSLLACGFSRLIIDPNRDVAANDLIPAVSDQIPIAGNQDLSEPDRARRIDMFHTPYHQRLEAAHDRLCAAPTNPPLSISIHSFTDRLMGSDEQRPWPIGFLWRADEPAARFLMNWLVEETGWPIGDNEPYDARILNYSVDRHIIPRGIRHLTLEIRQDKIDTPAGVDEMVRLLARGIGELTKTF